MKTLRNQVNKNKDVVIEISVFAVFCFYTELVTALHKDGHDALHHVCHVYIDKLIDSHRKISKSYKTKSNIMSGLAQLL